MASPFNMPDEFVQGFFKAGQTLLQAYTGAAGHAGDAPSVPANQPALALAQAQAHYWQQQMALYTGMMARATGMSTEPTVQPERGDRRFSSEAWRDNPWYSLLKQTYLLNSRLLNDMVEAAGVGEKEKNKLRFYARQFIDSMSPANFPVTNPDAIKTAVETQGESLRAGFANLLEDLKHGRISITDESAFEVGRNVAVSKGSVVFENELFQLIQYAPLTDKVAERPLVIVPPCINKFYILDLQPENSFVRFACEQGQTVFLVSWRNPDAELGHITWDDYVESGAINAARSAAPTRSMRSAGVSAGRYCRRRSRCCVRAAMNRWRASHSSRRCSTSAIRATWASLSMSRVCRSASRRLDEAASIRAASWASSFRPCAPMI
jgi:polyhydroxyalkanoate synthase